MSPFKITWNIHGGPFGSPWTQIAFEYNGKYVSFYGDEKEYETDKILRRKISGGKTIEDAVLIDSYISNAELHDPEFDKDLSKMMDAVYGNMILQRSAFSIDWRIGEEPSNWPNIVAVMRILRAWATEQTA